MRTGFFPWRIYWKIFFTLVVLLNLSSVLALGFAARQVDSAAVVGKLTLFGFLFFVFSLVISSFASYRVAAPLKRVIIKALRLSNKKMDLKVGSDDDLFEDEPGEYFELEQALDKIRKKMKKRRIQLAHEREESKALMSFLADAVISVDRDERVKFFNSRFATQFLDSEQLRGGEGELDLKLIDVFRDDEILVKIRETLISGQVQSLQKKMLTKLDRGGRYFSVVISPLFEEKNREVYGSLLLFHDITEYKVAEQIRVEFVENASHELRTPLTSIKGFVATARDDAEHGRYDQISDFMRIISKSVDRLIVLVDDLLTISSLERNASLRSDLVVPEELTEEVVEELSPLASEKRIMVKANYLCEPFHADARLLVQVLTNLLGNAIKYIQESGLIEVIWQDSPDRKQIQLIIRDNGPGIAEEHLNRLFERFYRVDKGRSRDVGGSGLGLAIVKHVLQSHGGGIVVKSRLGQGSEFICSFPRRS